MIKINNCYLIIIKVQNFLQMIITCNSCCQKQQLINKYTKLIKLLKTKYQKPTKSTLNSQSFSSQSLFQTSGSNNKSNQSNIGPDQFQSYKQPTISHFKEQKTLYLRLALTLISNKSSKYLLKQSFYNIKSAALLSKSNEQFLTKFQQIHLDAQYSFTKIIKQTLNHGRILQQQNNAPVFKMKQIYMKNFQLQILNSQFKQKIIKLQKQVEETQKRFLKEMEKKRQSLQAVAQQLHEKNNFIAQLQHTIKQYQKMSGKNFQKLSIENILIEDQLQLKRACLRLENINEKLNCDIKNLQIKIMNLNSDILLTKKQNLALKNQQNKLKEQNFDLLNQNSKINQIGQIYANFCHKINKKLNKMRLVEKKEASKIILKQNLISSSYDIFASKNTDASDSSPLSRKSSLKELQTQQKLEQIFSYIFNIHIQNYQIFNEQIFDEDEIKLLKSHKHLYLSYIHNQNTDSKKRTQKVVKNIYLNETDQIFYLQAPQLNFDNSFMNALEPSKNPSILNYFGQNLKLKDFQIEKSKLIQKISDLKKMHMHIRDIFLNFLKTIEFNNLKAQTLRILQIIFDVFEYSQDEKASLFKQKKKKFWGIL